jgi:molybdopterin synthase catalytic subunit
MTGRQRFRMTAERIDPDRLRDLLSDDRAGAYVSFEGWVRNRNEDQAVDALEYEAHAALAEREGTKILEEAFERFEVLDAFGAHRTGLLEIGDCAVWVGVSAAHRDAGFEACRYIIDSLKARVPIWKKEHYANGGSSWVNCATGASRGAAPD